MAPLYARYKYDGTITNTVTYPLTRALYGHRIRQPIGGDFGVSGDLVRHYLELDDWTDDISKFGIDIWMTTSALTGGFAVCQTRLGAKVHDPKDPGSDLGPDVPPGRGHDPAPRRRRTPTRGSTSAASHDVPGLRLRADHRPAAARGERDPPAVRVPRRLADARRHLARDARPGQRSRRSWPSPTEAGAPADAAARGWASAGRARPRRRHARDGRGPRRRSTSPTTCGRASSTTWCSRPGAARSRPGRWSRRSCRSTSGASAAS